ncbi:MAG: GntR family transcriptional regulator [Pseudomonadota bacterium]
MSRRYHNTTTESGRSTDLPSIFASTEDQSPWRRRFDHIHLAIRHRITILEYEPGARLDVDSLSEEFGVSRTPIRNVLQRLDTEGLVRTRHGVATIVAPLDPTELQQAFMFRIELASLIGILEPCRIEQSAVLAMQRLFEECNRLYQSVNVQAYAQIDMHMHSTICSVIGNSMLWRVYDEMYYRTARLRFCLLPKLDWEMEVTGLQKDIEFASQTMRNHDAKGFGFVVRNSIYNAHMRLKPLLNETPGSV